MFSYVVIFSIIACASASVLPSQRIVGGSGADITEAPFIAALLIDSTGSGVYTQACGAVIVGSRALLSSAQCTTPFAATRLRIRAGSTFHNTGGQVIQVQSVVNHPSYNASNFANDIAILILNTTITFGQTAMTVTLPAQNLSLADGTSCLFYGWGSLASGGSGSVNLQRVALPIINQVLCVSAYAGINTVTTNMMCMGRHGIGGVGPCTGDVGGPLVNGGLLHGISSWGRGCGEPNFPSIFTKISSYRTWINSYI